MLEVSALYIYPIKSLGGIEVSSAVVTDRGFQHDRRWLLVDMNNRFMTQREITQMALLQVTIETDGLRITHKIKGENILVPFTPQNGGACEVTVWESIVTAQYVSDVADEWFSRMLGMDCRLVYMPDDSHRRVDIRYAIDGEITTFADDYPFLIIGQSSLDDLNSRLAKPLPMN
ncbi:MAG: MOSC domain-containing protein, partial [Sphingobacteriales bacterium]